MNDDQKFVPLRTANKLIGVRNFTLRKWAKDGKLKTFTTPSGQILYDKSYLLKIANELPANKEKKNFVYCRVSSKKQLPDLERQIKQVSEQFPTYTVITDCASGINFKRKGLWTILDATMQGTIGEVVVAHKDRLSRFAFELIEQLIIRGGGKITLLDDKIIQSDEQELANDLLSIVHIFTCRQMGKRRYKFKNDQNSNSSKSETSDSS